MSGVRAGERRSSWTLLRSAWRSDELLTITEAQLQLLPPTLKMAAPFMEKLAEYLGSPEPAVRLILSVLLGK